jgi:acetolactate synthase-1/2/3 large subunit
LPAWRARSWSTSIRNEIAKLDMDIDLQRAPPMPAPSSKLDGPRAASLPAKDRACWIAALRRLEAALCGQWRRQPFQDLRPDQPLPFRFGALRRCHSARHSGQHRQFGAGVEAFYTVFRNKPGQRIFLTSGLGSMGYGLPAAIGACLANAANPWSRSRATAACS